MTREEALQNIKKAIGFSDTLDESIFTLFPELKESEDEKIREGLIRHLEELRDWKADTMSPIKVSSHYDAWIAWLEKPKEQKPMEYLPKEKVYDIMSKLTNLSYSNLIPINSEEYRKIEEITSNVLDLLNYPIEKKQEQKPVEWSGKDESMRKSIIQFLKSFVSQAECESNPSLTCSYPTYYKEVDWLESLHPQPKNEWNEEDEWKREGIIQWLRKHQKTYNPKYDSLSIESIDSLINWFKSLRSKPHWEPTKEQIEYLSKAILTLGEQGDAKTAAVLNELRKDLKKMMEE